MVYIGLRVEGCREYITGLYRVQGVGFRGTRIIYIYMYVCICLENTSGCRPVLFSENRCCFLRASKGRNHKKHIPTF